MPPATSLVTCARAKCRLLDWACSPSSDRARTRGTPPLRSVANCSAKKTRSRASTLPPAGALPRGGARRALGGDGEDEIALALEGGYRLVLVARLQGAVGRLALAVLDRVVESAILRSLTGTDGFVNVDIVNYYFRGAKDRLPEGLVAFDGDAQDLFQEVMPAMTLRQPLARMVHMPDLLGGAACSRADVAAVACR